MPWHSNEMFLGHIAPVGDENWSQLFTDDIPDLKWQRNQGIEHYHLLSKREKGEEK